ncbi:DUF1800 domain-containing protein [Octadecabacter sp.]|nr:DUF1800 domain-containing protein [Octadecabacter sp.]
MPFDPILASIRFGCGLSPDVQTPASVDDMLAMLDGPDMMAQQFPIMLYDTVTPSRLDFRIAGGAVSEAENEAAREAAQQSLRQMRAEASDVWARSTTLQLSREITTSDGFRERLTRFWADHFTAPPTNGQWRYLAYPYIEQDIRTHVTGQFVDMLRAAVMNPMLIHYLSQNRSVGPNSANGLRTGRGLNENLAREILELHTLGVGGAYTQTDVREFAELLTGITTNFKQGAFFEPNRAEPGTETVLGRTYGGNVESLDHIMTALDDLARHPDTARHLSEKLVEHFIGPEPQPELVAAMARTYDQTDGNLMAVYDVMLRDDAAWSPELRKVKQPFGFMSSSMRALAVSPDVLMGLSYSDVARMVFRPLTYMGQTIHQPVGPDGWAEEDEAWITPQGMAGRITWAMQMPDRLLDPLPDPREFIHHALGPTPPDAVVFAAGAAETISDGVGIVLASAAFQRR